jgi:hypothetical protein
MAYLVLGAFLVVVLGLSWFSHRRGLRVRSCCAPADARDDLRMRGALDDE